MTNKKHPSEYLNDLEEWQNHQYDPGHYLGGNIRPQLKYGLGTKGGKYLGILFLVFGVMSGIVMVKEEKLWRSMKRQSLVNLTKWSIVCKTI